PVATTLTTASLSLSRAIAMTPTTPVTATGGTAPLTWTVSPALPAGLALNSSTGQITGTPNATQSSTAYTITARDARGS
ncbi:putative Ig domain-containing protein, partial [Escherichia coli]|uniref:putative Ig domain-containing protein n=1 Tax=Escherichia coli TaxID=562 RepID=UPI0026F80C38